MARIAVAFVVYLALRGVWTWVGLDGLYNSLVMGFAERIFVPTQHFPVVPDLSGLSLTQLDFIVVFAISLFVVSTGMPWGRRLKRYGAVLAVVFGLHVVTILFHVKVMAAQDMNEQYQLPLMLPVEFEIVDHLKYLLYDLGLQWGPFLLALLAALWNSRDPVPRSRRRTVRSRRALWVGGAVLALLVLIGAAWHRWRESHPLHVAAHARLGYLCHQDGNLEGAARHYRIAVDAETDLPHAYYHLAMIESRAGRKREAIELLRRGQTLAPDPEWAPRFEKAIADLRTSAP